MTLRQIRQALLLILGLILVLSGITYSSLLQRGYVVVKFSALLIGATALLSLLTYALAVGRRWTELRDPILYLLLGEIGVLVISVIFSGQSWVSLLGSMPRLMGAITVACFVVAALSLIVAVGDRRERLIPILRVVAVTTGVAGLNAIYEWPSNPIFRPPGLVGNAEFLSNYLLFGALGTLALLFVERSKGWAIATAVAAAFAAVGMSVIRTRGAWLGYGVGVVTILLLVNPLRVSAVHLARGRRHLGWLSLSTLGVAILSAAWGYATASHPIGWNLLLPFLPVIAVSMTALPWLLAPLPGVRHAMLGLVVAATVVAGYSVTTQRAVLPYKLAEALRLTQESARGVVYDDTLRMLKKHWLIGCGIENFRVAFLGFKSERLARADPRVNYRNPHNMPLYEWTTNGLPGILVYLALLGFAVIWLLRARKRGGSGPWALFAAGLLATLVGYTVQNLFNYDVIPTGLHYYVFLAMAVVLRRASRRDLPADAEAAPAGDTPDDSPGSSDDKKSPHEGDPWDEGEGRLNRDESKRKGGQEKKKGKKGRTEGEGRLNRDESKRKGGQEEKKGKKGKTAGKTKKRGKPTAAPRSTGDSGKRSSHGRKEANKPSRHAREKQALAAEQRMGALRSRQAVWLSVGLIGALALYVLLYQIPPIRDLFRFVVGSDLPSRGDILGALLIVATGGTLLAVGLSSPKPKDRFWRLFSGLLAVIVLVSVFYAVPWVRDVLTKTPSESGPHPKNDILPAILVLAWAGFWLIVALSADLFDEAAGAAPVALDAPSAMAPPDTSSPSEDVDQRLRASSWSLALLVLVFVGLGSWWAGRNLKADYALYRARAIAGATARRYGASIQRYQGALQQLQAMLRRTRGQGATAKAQRIERRILAFRQAKQKLATKLRDRLARVRRYGHAAAHAMDVLGYYHFQYSKALHPFLKARGALDRSTYRSLLRTSLSEARRGVHQNTNPESAWSHLAVVYLAAQDLQAAKRALAQSIKFDPYYYDTHRMMALLHLQDGHIDEAVREMHRSLDITEGKHFVNSQTALRDFLKAARAGHWKQADTYRARMWYWLKRGHNFPGMPVQVLFWQRNFEWWARAEAIAKALASQDLKKSGRMLAAENRLPRSFRIPWAHRKELMGLREGLAGRTRQAVHHLRSIRPKVGKSKTVVARFVDLAAGLSSVLPPLEALLHPKARQRPGQQDRTRGRAAAGMIVSEGLYLRVLAVELTLAFRRGGKASMGVARRAAEFLAAYYRRRQRDLYTIQFRRPYRQVLRAQPQVAAAATPRGRLSYLRRFLRGRRPRLDAALLVADQLLARYPKKGADALYFRGVVLERQRRPGEARLAYEAYLKARPNGQNTSKARERLRQLSADPP